MAQGPICALDLGSRNFKAVLGEVRDGEIRTRLLAKETLDLRSEIARHDGVIGEAKLAQVRACLKRLVEAGRREGAHVTVAIGTRAIRNARNGECIVECARELGVELEIVSGEREAVLGYLAATGGAAGRLVSDFGSHSLQLAWERAGRIETACIGSGYEDAYTAFFDGAASFASAAAAFRDHLDEHLPQVPTGTEGLVCLAANTLVCHVTGKSKSEITDRPLDAAVLRDALTRLDRMDDAALRSYMQETARASKILPGMVLLHYLLERSGHAQAQIAQAELPVGLLVEYFQARAAIESTDWPGRLA